MAKAEFVYKQNSPISKCLKASLSVTLAIKAVYTLTGWSQPKSWRRFKSDIVWLLNDSMLV